MSADASASDEHWVPSLLQVSDPLFPTGGYAHSLGLEQWIATCGLKTSNDLTQFFMEHAGPALARVELPYLRFARETLVDGKLEALF